MKSLFYQFQQINELLKDARRILVASHQRPDSDAVASVLSLHRLFQKQGRESFPYLPDSPPKRFSFLPGFFEIRTELNSFQPDFLFGLDYGDFERLKFSENFLPEERIITIDHHLESDQRGKIKIIGPGFSSTAEIIYYWLKFSNLEIDREIATCLLAGIFSDSGGFSHVAITSKTLKAVSDLLARGIPVSKIARKVSALDNPISVSRAWGRILSRTKVNKKTGLAYSWINFEDLKKYKVRLSDFGGITNLLCASSQRNLGLFLMEYEKGKIKGSLRAEPYHGKSIVRVAETLGGGGHPYAAGFEQEGTVESILKKVLDLIQ